MAICLTVAEVVVPTVGCSKVSWKSFSEAQPRVKPSVLSKILYMTDSRRIFFPGLTLSTAKSM